MLATALAWVVRWIVQHHRQCHTQPLARVAALEQRIAGCEDECERLAKNAHDDRNKLSQVSLWSEMLRERLGMK
jgi:hypothetical protein